MLGKKSLCQNVLEMEICYIGPELSSITPNQEDKFVRICPRVQTVQMQAAW